MSFIAVFHNDDGASVEVFATFEGRKNVTCKNIYGDMAKESMRSFENYEFQSLRREGKVSFEGDPPIEWLDDHDRDGFKVILAR